MLSLPMNMIIYSITLSLRSMVRIGKIVATHGLNGDLVMTHIVGASTWLEKGAVLFLELNKGSFIPYFVTGCKAVSDEEYIVTFEDVAELALAKKLIGKQVYVQEEIIKKEAEHTPLLWIGFNIIDKEKGGLGVLEDVMETGHQWLGKLTYNGKEVLIPLIEQMIVDINIRNKYIRVNLPEGLLEL